MTTKELKRRAQSRATAAPKLSIENRPIEQIHPYLGNPRTHTPKQVRRIADSIGEFGLAITDPPYNVPIHGHVSGLGRNRHREFVQASGEMSEAEFIRFLTSALTCIAKASRNGSLHYIFMDWSHLFELLSAGRSVYDELKSICVWNKTNAGLGSLYRSQHEMVAVFKKGSPPHINNVELGKHGRHRSNVWTYAGANSFSATRDADLAAHPTVKPTALIADAILDASKRGDLVLDPFGGSGTTLLAAQQCERVARLAELDPLYCDLIIRRAEAATGNTAIHAETGQTFQEMSALRSVAVSHG